MDDTHYYYGQERREVAALLPATAARRVLEIGCGQGAFRSNFTADVDYWGVEPTADAAAIAQGRLTRLLRGTFEDHEAALPDGHFDLVICNDVIEHMIDHDRFLDAIKAKLAPGGAIVGSLPNVRFITNLYRLMVGRDWAYAESGILDTTHLRFFTRKSMARTFAAHGYRVERLEGLNPVGSSHSGARRLIVRLVAGAAALVLGGDIRFVQFGFRIRPAA